MPNNKLVSKQLTTGWNVYAAAKNLNGLIWDVTLADTTFTAIDVIDWPDDAPIVMDEEGASGQYSVEIPAALPAGVYEFTIRRMVGGDETLTDPEQEIQTWYWDGTNKHHASQFATAIDQSYVPPSRTWILMPTADRGLIGEAVKSCNVGDVLTFAVDFRNDLSTNAAIQSVEEPVLEAGSGITFGARGRAGSIAKIRITAASEGLYTIDVPVTYEDGSTQSGTVELKVVA